MTITRPDIAYAVHVIFQFMHAPRTTHLHTVKHIFCYFQGISKHGLWFCPTTSPTLVVAYFDTDWAAYRDSCRSTIGYAVFLGPNLIPWCSKKQLTGSKSSAETKYRAIGYTVVETIWICKLLYDLGVSLSIPVCIYCNNLSATYMSANRSKHIAVDYHNNFKMRMTFIQFQWAIAI